MPFLFKKSTLSQINDKKCQKYHFYHWTEWQKYRKCPALNRKSNYPSPPPPHLTVPSRSVKVGVGWHGAALPVPLPARGVQREVHREAGAGPHQGVSDGRQGKDRRGVGSQIELGAWGSFEWCLNRDGSLGRIILIHQTPGCREETFDIACKVFLSDVSTETQLWEG